MDELEQIFFEDPAEESEEDIPPLDLAGVRSAFVTGSDWTTETIIRQMRKDNIHLNPRFQRREVWTRRRKSEFIESILLNLPIPQIVLAEQRSDRNTFIVLDGKQRLLTLRQYASNPMEFPEDTNFPPFKLASLTVRDDLNRTSYSDLHSAPTFLADRNAFDNHTIRTVVIRNWPDEDFLYRVFLRLNTGSVPLAPQELRQALLPGPFIDFADDFALGSEQIKNALGIERPDRRMRDTELLVRYFAFTQFLGRYTGNLKPFLDLTCDELNNAWRHSAHRIKDEAHACEAAIEATISVFGKNAFRRWRPEGYERAFNRAVYDSMVYFLRDPGTASLAVSAAPAVEAGFRELCAHDAQFDQALAATTKTVVATAYRIVRWGDQLSAVLKTQVDVPQALRARARL